MLARRLIGRGVALSAGTLAAALSQNAASAGVPAPVLMSTIKAASLLAAGEAAIPVKVAALAEGVLKTMLLTKLKSATAVLFVAVLVGLIGYGIASAQQKEDKQDVGKPRKVEGSGVKEKGPVAWGKEVDGLQAGLVADASTYRHGEKVKLTLKLRNVSKADVKITHGLLRESPPEVITADGAKVTVFMPPLLGIIVIPVEQVVKPGETITLYNPEVAAEPEGLMRLEGIMRVDTPTICVDPGKYKIAYGGMIQSHPKLKTGTVELTRSRGARRRKACRPVCASATRATSASAGRPRWSSSCATSARRRSRFQSGRCGLAIRRLLMRGASGPPRRERRHRTLRSFRRPSPSNRERRPLSVGPTCWWPSWMKR
jgi:hypothetical protein